MLPVTAEFRGGPLRTSHACNMIDMAISLLALDGTTATCKMVLYFALAERAACRWKACGGSIGSAMSALRSCTTHDAG